VQQAASIHQTSDNPNSRQLSFRQTGFSETQGTRRAGAVRPRPFPFRVVRCYRTNLRASRATATTIAASIINFLKLTYLLLPKSVFVPD
jgi:hypothetical protein